MPHSEEYLLDSRLDWYNSDFLELMARRLHFDSIKIMADVGCGLGHWSRTLLPFLPRLEKLFALDFEEDWIKDIQSFQALFKRGISNLFPF